jgi:diguanylate cyclase (GGDEF)-like protein
VNRDDESCAACHTNGAEADDETVFLDRKDGGTRLRSMHLFENEKDCQECHDADERFLGVLVVDRELDRDLVSATDTRRSLIGIGVATLLAVAGLVFLIVQYLVQRPVDVLIAGTRRIRDKDFGSRIDTRTDGELGELATAFNAMVIDTRSHIQEIKNKSFELSTLYSIVDRVTRSIDMENLRKIILDIVWEAFSGVHSALIIIRPRDDHEELLIGAREVGKEMTTNIVVDSGELDNIGYGVDASLLRRWRAGDIAGREVHNGNRLALVPLRPGGRDIGLLAVSKAGAEEFGEMELHLLDALDAHVSVALENARLYSLAITDELTRAYTLRYFQHTLQDEVARYKRYGQKLSLLMIDIDDFKSVNDTHGHPAGDEALRQVVRVLRESVREVDVVCRYGGEEFAVILPNADSKAAQVVAERIRAAAETRRFRVAAEVALGVTVSVGVSCCPADGDEVRKLVDAADNALYRAKRSGKNRVVQAGDLPVPAPATV